MFFSLVFFSRTVFANVGAIIIVYLMVYIGTRSDRFDYYEQKNNEHLLSLNRFLHRFIMAFR